MDCVNYTLKPLIKSSKIFSVNAVIYSLKKVNSKKGMKDLRILHTSDWHIGKKLKEHERLDEFRKFFEWLGDTVSNENIDVLLVSGDIFDSINPSIEAQEIYYSFLAETSGKLCGHVIIISGNHDSAPFIDAPSSVMRRCNVHVIGSASEDPSDEIITLKNSDGKTELIVCAVPFLHDKDLRTVNEGEGFDDIDTQIKTGIVRHYESVLRTARELRGSDDVPIIAMGHLFLEAGKTLNGEGEHSLYVGTAAKVGSDIFTDDIAYTALGHLHSPQKIGRADIRYSGSPIALTFGELGVQKSVSIVDFDGKNFAGVREIPVPVFQRMERVSGNWQEIESSIMKLACLDESVWLEVTYSGSEQITNLQESLDKLIKPCPNLEVLSVIDEMNYRNDSETEISAGLNGRTLDDIEPVKMLQSLMKIKDTPEDKQPELERLYRQILNEISSASGDK